MSASDSDIAYVYKCIIITSIMFQPLLITIKVSIIIFTLLSMLLLKVYASLFKFKLGHTFQN